VSPTILRVVPSVVATYVPPVGIPAPAFGVVEQPRQITHWVNNGHPLSTDTNNPVGTRSQPRKTVPLSLPAGSVVDVRGSYGIGQVTWTSGGTLATPVFVIGTGATRFTATSTTSWLRTAGGFLVVEGVILDGVQVQITGTAQSLRYAEVLKTQASAVVAGPTSVATVIFRCRIHHNGDFASATERDVHGVLIEPNAQAAWLLESDVHHNGGDSIQVGQATSTEPWTRHVFIGANRLHEDRENAIDIKKARDVIASQNVAYGYKVTSSSSGEVVVVHDGSERIFIVNNLLAAGEFGVSCTNAIGLFVLGNVITIRHNPAMPWDPASLFGSSAIHVRNSASAYLSANTIDDCDAGVNIPILTTGSASEVVSNIFSRCGQTVRYGNDSTRAAANVTANLLNVDPRFVAAGNYRIQPSSPARGVGVPSAAAGLMASLYSAPLDRDIYGTSWASPRNMGAAA
jgi:hypothetical protein